MSRGKGCGSWCEGGLGGRGDVLAGCLGLFGFADGSLYCDVGDLAREERGRSWNVADVGGGVAFYVASILLPGRNMRNVE